MWRWLVICVAACGFSGKNSVTDASTGDTVAPIDMRVDGPPGDDDADGIADMVDNCPTTPNTNQADGDTDGDGDACDNCPKLANADQANGDADAAGDVCDNCVAAANDDQHDEDEDADGDACDNCPTWPNATQSDTDSDEVGNACDLRPNTPGDSIVFFESFQSPNLHPMWQVPALAGIDGSNTWMIVDDALVQSQQDNATRLLARTDINVARGSFEINYTVTGFNDAFAVNYVAVFGRYAVAGANLGNGYLCAQRTRDVVQGPEKERVVSILDIVAMTGVSDIISTTDFFSTTRVYRNILDSDGSTHTCTRYIDGVLNGQSSDTSAAHSQGGVAISTLGAGASIRSVVVYGRQ